MLCGYFHLTIKNILHIECVKRIQINEASCLFLSQFLPLLNWASFLEAELKIGLGAIQIIRVKFWSLFRHPPPPLCQFVLYPNKYPPKIGVKLKASLLNLHHPLFNKNFTLKKSNTYIIDETCPKNPPRMTEKTQCE